MGDKWTLLIVRDLAAGPRRFVELQRVLPGISTEQLRSRLNRMVADGLLTRERYREVPPRVDYELTERARELLDVVGALARWGYEWAWSAPRPGERVDIGAILRTAPGLLSPAPSTRGVVDCVVLDEHGAGRHHVLHAAGGSVSIREGVPETADATVTGNVDAWVRALCPDADQSRLEFSGDRQLADRLLGGLTDAAGGAEQSAVA